MKIQSVKPSRFLKPGRFGSKKLLLFITIFICFFGHAQDLVKIRSQYPQAVENSETTAKLNNELSKIDTSDKAVIVAYKGAVMTLMAKFAKSKKDKKGFFKDGAALIEGAINAEPQNIEIRYIRLTVQENSPKFLGYHKNIEVDKRFILDNYPNVSSKELKEVVKDFVLKSESFNETEKKSIQ